MDYFLATCFGYNKDSEPSGKVRWYMGDSNEPISLKKKKKK